MGEERHFTFLQLRKSTHSVLTEQRNVLISFWCPVSLTQDFLHLPHPQATLFWHDKRVKLYLELIIFNFTVDGLTLETS